MSELINTAGEVAAEIKRRLQGILLANSCETDIGRQVMMGRRRFPADVVSELLAIRWWDWDAARITRNLDAIRGADLAALKAAA